MHATEAQAEPVRLDAVGLGNTLRSMLAIVREHEDELNRLNVYPVRDHDTGTNMALTLEGVVKAVEATGDRPLRELAVAVVDAALLEARGNSGIILAEVLRGLFETWAPLEGVGPADLVRGFRAAAERADQAMVEPVEGTIVTVARATARALQELPEDDPAVLLAAAADAAGRAVEATTQQLDVLRHAGVVDAAGRGLELCLRAFAATAAGRPRSAVPEPAGTPEGARSPRADQPPGPAFEVQYLVACSEQDAEGLRHSLATIGDSIAVARSNGLYRIHVHTDDAGAAIEEAVQRGRTSKIQVAYLRREPSGTAPTPNPEPTGAASADERR
ncbi:MAG TPA: DAK2 domain-containing protein [Actinomycetes bacterium]|jgi:dihydroxyacetone kinase-like predicted kinase|nr:DAK2 domain-containing protein [Actinomycetes bacterium]